MKEWKFIGFDLGAESGRCFVADFYEGEFKLKEVHRFPSHSINTQSGLHWDVLAIFNELLKGLTEAGKQFGNNFDGIAVSTWGVDYVLIDADGRVLGYPYHYRDNRTDGIMSEAFSIIPEDLLYTKTGNQSAQYNTLFQLFSEKKRKNNLLSSAEKMLLMPDFFTYMLSGSINAEYTIASTTGLTDPYSRNWSHELIDAFGLPEKIFPQMVEPGTRSGGLLNWIAEKTGLTSGIPVYKTAGHDTASAVAALSAYQENQIFLSSGTWSLLGINLNEPLTSAQAMRSGFTNEGGINKTTRFLRNIIGLWPLQECRKVWRAEGQDFSYNDLAGLASNEGFIKAWINPDDPEFLKPGNMPEKIVKFLQKTGQTFNAQKGFLTAVILESLAFTCRMTVKSIAGLTNRKSEILLATGGGINNYLLTQYIADAAGLKVLAGPVEGAIIGNIAIQAAAAGVVKDINSFKELMGGSFEVKTYEPVNREYFDKYENCFEKINCKS